MARYFSGRTTNAKCPITFGKDADYPMPEHATKAFMIKSQISTVIYPKQGEQWLARTFSPAEIRGIRKVGRWVFKLDLKAGL